ncbi:hypothetical protein [Thermosipho atlanticus]|uniref:Capsule assembly protein Wzi n=1 Tax=Thermosipho atlanticus DSM 15807 TaxID=1123380 RepID=A0A1M5RWL7_9BACT|nr:hypothetical protein [Thermosipho atlanticus]SHH30722.1 hypothetical protein SAMN02745199_0667 [Thermosipho atlanticus DSM 15807]
MKKVIFLVLILVSLVTFSELIYNASTAALPIPSEWLNGDKNLYDIKIKIAPWFSFGKWNTFFITNDSWGWGASTNPAENVFYLFNEIPPFLNLSFKFSKNGFTLFSSVNIQKGLTTRTKEFGTNLFFNNFNFELLSFDTNFPELFYICYANNFSFVSIGRYPLKWGFSKYPITISNTTFQDNITFSTKISNFRYTYHFISSYPLLTPAEQNIQSTYSDQHTPGKIFDEPYKTIIAHKFDFEFNKLKFGIGELNVVGGKVPDIIDINPLMFFHNTFGEGYSNVLANIDFKYTITDNFYLYGEFSLDDFQVPFTEAGSNYKPGAHGYNIGGEFKYKNFSFWVEYDHTSEWMYITNYLPYLNISVRHFFLDNLTSPNRSLMDFPLGFKYGPDATMVSVGLNYSFSDFKIKIEYNFLVKGTVIDDGIQRWKWFWDAWYGNVTPAATYSVEDSDDIMYNILDIKLNFKRLYLKFKTVNFEDYLLGAYFIF